MHWSRTCVAILAIAMATSAAAIAAPARDSNTKTATAGRIEFGIDREEYIAQARAALQGDPVIASHIGAIRELRLDDGESLKQPGDDVLVFDVKGSRGQGRVTARFVTVDEHREVLGAGRLVMAGGEEHPIAGADPDAAGVGLVESMMGFGLNVFAIQAREAVQRYPDTARHLGDITSFKLDTGASMNASGMQAFVFDVVGSKASGRIEADFITVDGDTERLGKGVLILSDGRRIAFDGEAPFESELAVEDGSESQGEGPFITQARAAVQRYPLTAGPLGQIERFDYNAEATMNAPGALTFVFDVVGSKASGRISADFITVDADTERLGAGTLTLAGGREIRFEGEPPVPGEQQAFGDGDFQIPDDSPFVLQARDAVARYPLLAGQLGEIATFSADSAASMATGGGETFVFDVTGSKASGRLVADFITVDADTERLGPGTLTLADGREIRFDGEAPFPQETQGEAMSEQFAAQDSAFVRQAIVAIRAHAQVRRHLGEVREALIDREASWAMPGDQYAFDLVGSKGRGRIEADFITVDADSERIGAGTLVLANGRRIAFDDR